MAKADAGVEGRADAGDESEDGQKVMGDGGGVAAEEGDAGEDDVAGEGSGEDAAVGDEEEGVEEAAGEAEEQRGGERLRGADFRCGGRRGFDRQGHGLCDSTRWRAVTATG